MSRHECGPRLKLNAKAVLCVGRADGNGANRLDRLDDALDSPHVDAQPRRNPKRPLTKEPAPVEAVENVVGECELAVVENRAEVAAQLGDRIDDLLDQVQAHRPRRLRRECALVCPADRAAPRDHDAAAAAAALRLDPFECRVLLELSLNELFDLGDRKCQQGCVCDQGGSRPHDCAGRTVRPRTWPARDATASRRR